MTAPQLGTSAALDPIDSGPAPHLKRVLGLWGLIIYGVVSVTPSAPATVFGLAEWKSHGHAVVTILAGMLAMVLTAISYGRMAGVYPSAGSVYTYVGRGLHPYVGFAAGWAMLLEYIASPLFCVMFGALAITRAAPRLPFALVAAVLAVATTVLNLRGVRATARANAVLTVFMMIILASYIVLAIGYIVVHQGWVHLFSVRPFYSPGTVDLHSLASGTSFAALTFLGFDAVTTLAEDVHDPRRNVSRAAVVVCIFTGLFGGLLVYLGQLAWPDYTTYKNIDTAFIEVAGRVGGVVLFRATAILLVVANVGAALTTQLAAAHLMYGMGRDNVIPRRFFGHLHPERSTPDYNVCLLGVVSYAGALVIGYEVGAEILTFGAFLGFMAVNLAVISVFWVRRVNGHRRNFVHDVLLPGLGFVFCTVIFVGLGGAMLTGVIWFALGALILGIHTRGFREPLALSDPAEEDGEQ